MRLVRAAGAHGAINLLVFKVDVRRPKRLAIIVINSTQVVVAILIIHVTSSAGAPAPVPNARAGSTGDAVPIARALAGGTPVIIVVIPWLIIAFAAVAQSCLFRIGLCDAVPGIRAHAVPAHGAAGRMNLPLISTLLPSEFNDFE
ncbi:MAG: hypothetical protein JOY99_07250 [Sphingomonadaceae bacterium]|nr:hypothetical protein [Sphingomonadaceae bacterium]